MLTQTDWGIKQDLVLQIDYKISIHDEAREIALCKYSF